ncbi:hypothetical protein PF008_g28449 [Phytophthora fragariae]|uniref:Uncharacterized protein n=1 Tax=Phytophthora fragariae TaxID=53985 RepID=A0A6G0QBB0_9STRA|nr:hypothetical protein PF008_g28449 [Phytophthora fragariae]
MMTKSRVWSLSSMLSAKGGDGGMPTKHAARWKYDGSDALSTVATKWVSEPA